MRLMETDLKAYSVYRPRAVLSDYIGTKTEYVENGAIRAQVQPVTDKVSVALYGNRVEKMKNLVCPYGVDLRKGDKVEIDGEKHKVVGLLTYSTHITAAVELEGATNGG